MMIPGDNRPSQLKVVFEGLFYSDSEWSLTNVRIVFGCKNFLIFDEVLQECSQCMDGFYADGLGEACLRCPPTCSKCKS